MVKRAAIAPRTSSVTEETREMIIAGAARAFGKLGHANARVEDILQAAGVSRPTFYKAFEDKDAVFELLSLRHHRTIRERILASLEGVQDTTAQLEATTGAFMRWRAELGPIGRVLDTEARTPGTPIARHRQKSLREMTTLMGHRMAAAGRAPADPVIFMALIAAMEAIADAMLSQHRASPEEVARATRCATRILAGTLAAPNEAIPPLPAPPPAG